MCSCILRKGWGKGDDKANKANKDNKNNKANKDNEDDEGNRMMTPAPGLEPNIVKSDPGE